MLGIYTIAISVFMVFATIISSGLPISISKYSAKQDRTNQNKLVYSGLIISIITTLICCAVIILFKSLFEKLIGSFESYSMLLVLIPALIFTGIYTPIKGNFWGNEKYFQSGVVEFIEQIIRILICILCFLMLSNNLKYLSPAIAISAGCIVSTIYGIYLYKKNNCGLRINNQFLLPLIKSSAPITAVRFFSSVIQPIIAIILPLRLMAFGMDSSGALSELGIAMGMTMPILSIPFTLIGSLSMALIPKISTMKKEKKHNELNNQIKSSIKFTLIAVFLFIPVFVGVGNGLCEFVFSNQSAGKYLVYSAWLIIPMGLSQITTTILNAMGEEFKSFIYYLISGIFLLAIIWFMPKYIGVFSVIYALGVSNIITAILNIIKLNKITQMRKTFLKELILLSILSVPCTMLTRFSSNILSAFLPEFISIGISSVIAIISLGVLLIYFNFIDFQYISNSIKILTKKKKQQSPFTNKFNT